MPGTIPTFKAPPVPPTSAIGFGPNGPSSLTALTVPSNVPVPELVVSTKSESVTTQQRVALHSFGTVNTVRSAKALASPLGTKLCYSTWIYV